MREGSTSSYADSCGCAIGLDRLDSKETTEKIDRRATQPAQVACASENPKRRDRASLSLGRSVASRQGIPQSRKIHGVKTEHPSVSEDNGVCA